MYPKCLQSTSQNPYGTVVGGKFLSHLKPGVIKDLTKSIRVQLDTASTSNTLPERLAQSLIPRGQKITNDLTRYKATLFTDDNSKLTPMGRLELLAETTTGYHLLTFHVLRGEHIQGKPPLLSGSDCVNCQHLRTHMPESFLYFLNRYLHHGCLTIRFQTYRCHPARPRWLSNGF